MLTDFRNYFIIGLSSKQVMKRSPKNPPHLNHVATLAREM